MLLQSVAERQTAAARNRDVGCGPHPVDRQHVAGTVDHRDGGERAARQRLLLGLAHDAVDLGDGQRRGRRRRATTAATWRSDRRTTIATFATAAT